MNSNRREFLQQSLALGAGCALGMGLISSNTHSVSASANRQGLPRYHEASHYRMTPAGTAQCLLCPVQDTISEGAYSLCRVRTLRRGKLYTATYGHPCAMHLDPVEKNPLYHFHPGMRTLALATAGCNLACPACQNWEMSQKRVEEIKFFNLPPAQAVSYAKKNNCGGMSYTFTEPAVFFEYCLDTCRAARQQGLKNSIVSGGYINPSPLQEMIRVSDSFCISLKGLDPEMYGGGPRPRILETIRSAMAAITKSGKWLEIAVLVIPTKNDSEKQLFDMTKWVKDNLGEFVPIHFSRFYPSFQLRNIPQTPVALLENAQKTAVRIGIKYAYVGNVPGHILNNTYCHNCKKMLVQRVGFRILKNEIQGGKCKFCSANIPGVWS